MSAISTIQIPPGSTSLLVDTRPGVSKLLQLPSVIANPGRVLMIKDFYGNASNSSFMISTTGTDYIEDVIRSYTFSNSFGSVNLLSDGASSWRFIGSYDGTASSTMNVVNKGVMASTIPTSAFVVQLDVTSTIKTVTLPVVSTNAGRMLIIKDAYGKSGASTIVLSTVGADRFELSSCSTFALSEAYGSWTLLNDAVNTWYLSEFYRNTLTIASGPITLGGGGFSPKSILTISLWLDATDPNNNGSLPSNGSVVSTWVDKSGLGNNLTGISNPTFVTSPTRMSNFSGAYFSGSAPTSYLMTLFIVYYDNNNDGCAPVYTENPNADVTGLFPNCGGTTYMQPGWATQGSSIPKNTQNLLVIQYTPTNGYIWLNGTLNFTINSSSFGRSAISFAKRGGNYMNGYYYEIAYYNSVLTTTNRQLMEGYLAWKWSLQANLPSGHPYKSAAP
jgi:hypothetical protein